MSLVTLAEYKASVYHDASRAYTDDQLTQALLIAEDSFYSRTGRHDLGYWIEARTRTVKLSSTGTSTLRCPFPVLGLVSVSVDGTDLDLDDVRFNGHFLNYTTKFGSVPDSIDETAHFDVVVVAKFGDPSDKIERDSELDPTIPWDVKNCVMRMAWHQLRREFVTKHQSTSRDAKPSKEARVDISRDAQINQTVADWTVVENSGSFDFR